MTYLQEMTYWEDLIEFERARPVPQTAIVEASVNEDVPLATKYMKITVYTKIV